MSLNSPENDPYLKRVEGIQLNENGQVDLEDALFDDVNGVTKNVGYVDNHPGDTDVPQDPHRREEE